MLAGELYRPDEELGAEQASAKAWMVRYNAALASPVSERHALLCERLGRVGKDAVIRPPFHCDYGYNISLGGGVFLNFNCVILDVVEVTIGGGAIILPGVTIGDGAVIGAGSVVTRDVGPGVTVAGNPARPRQA